MESVNSHSEGQAGMRTMVFTLMVRSVLKLAQHPAVTI